MIAGRPRPKQHVTGDFGERFFAYTLPAEWVIHPYKGSEDYGLDFHVEIFTDGKPAGLEFGAQVRTTEKQHKPNKALFVTLSRDNILYLASKTYPSMLVFVNRAQQSACYAWFRDVIAPNELADILRGRQRRRLRLKIGHPRTFAGSGDEIRAFVHRYKATLLAWLESTVNRQSVADLYFDLHAALDALIDCLDVIHRGERDPDVLSHKLTYTVMVVGSAYSILHFVAVKERERGETPVTGAFIALAQRCRTVLSKIIPDPYLEELEKQDGEDVKILPGITTDFWPSVSRFAAVFNDCLRTLAPLLAPWRDFQHGMSALASHVIDGDRPSEATKGSTDD